ncbi:hypothetical protein SDRG_12852 [Saprolegnia diclina VS20]|uniref:ABC transmembrane type-1 domain-containing protein n=1 Tax=Saprolegnia diclina (strain VS20) TaxID=1156394 RepID=T0PV62_SAPDV|nr:hypothetical protein SDRG_12852 [Saprolegnia diclina VS20]EQC29389.1 hypothetical protein SDRG_12852 [Saprolegnia diclina VS20]|eukprot:XP_008617156.1 hypothetical protein SDRG_12852 [Saprolegnia diclina VS20]
MAKYMSVAATAKPAADVTHPLTRAGYLSKITFGWANALLALGHERQIDPDDLWPLAPENTCKAVSSVFEPSFTSSHSIVKTIFSLYGWRLFLVGLLQALTLGCTLYGPIVLKTILTAVEGPSFDLVRVLKFVVSLFAVKALQAILTAHANLANQLITIKITSALQHLLFQKALVLDAACRREKTAGEIANMFSSDIQWIISFAMYTNQIWLIPLQLFIVLGMLYDVIGWATFVGAGVIAITLLSNNVLANAQRNAFKTLMTQKDERMKAVNEVFGAMQIIKLNAWEEKFGDKIAELRRDEVSTLSYLVTLTSVQIGCLYSAPVLVTVSSFAIYALVMQQAVTAAKVFTALSLFTLLRGPMMNLPQVVANLMQAVVALKRIMEFLDMDEKDTDVVKTPETISTSELNAYAEKKIDIEIADGTFAWDVSGKPLFNGINLQIKRGEFVLVHGAVGEGKSSLVSALLGEMHKRHGSVFVGGQRTR